MEQMNLFSAVAGSSEVEKRKNVEKRTLSKDTYRFIKTTSDQMERFETMILQ